VIDLFSEMVHSALLTLEDFAAPVRDAFKALVRQPFQEIVELFVGFHLMLSPPIRLENGYEVFSMRRWSQSGSKCNDVGVASAERRSQNGV
jgi:hypothetical protein